MYMARGMLACLGFRVCPRSGLDPKGRGAARRGCCFNPPQCHPDTNLLGFRVFNLFKFGAQSGQMTNETLERETRVRRRPRPWLL